MVITISRQYLAGATAVATRIAEGLGWNVVDDALIEEVAARSGYTSDEVKSLEESVPTFLERFAQSSALSFPEFLVSTPSAMDEPDAVKLAHVTRDVIEEIGHREHTIMIGRAAAAVLAQEEEAIHVRLVASRAYRIRLAMQHLGESEANAAHIVDEHDTNRERYHAEIYRRDWNDPLNYHMILNTELLGTDGAGDLVISRVRSLGW